MRFSSYLFLLALTSAPALANVPLWGRFDFYSCVSRDDCKFVRGETLEIEIEMISEPPGELHGIDSFTAKFAGKEYRASVDLYISGGSEGDADLSTFLEINPGRSDSFSQNFGHLSLKPISSLGSISFPEFYSKNGRQMVSLKLGYGKAPYK